MKKQYISPITQVVHIGGTNNFMQQQLIVGSTTDPNQPVDKEEDIGWVKPENRQEHYNVWNDDWSQQ